MRRRRRGGRRLTAEEVVAVYGRASAENAGASLEVRNYAVRTALAEHGYSPVDAIRARYWLRRGQPADYLWDDFAAHPSHLPMKGHSDE